MAQVQIWHTERTLLLTRSHPDYPNSSDYEQHRKRSEYNCFHNVFHGLVIDVIEVIHLLLRFDVFCWWWREDVHSTTIEALR